MPQHGRMDPVVTARCLDLTQADVDHPRVWSTQGQVDEALTSAGADRLLRPMRAHNRHFHGWIGAQPLQVSDARVTVRFLVQDDVSGVLTCRRPTDVDPPAPRALTADYVNAHLHRRMILLDSIGPVDATLLMVDGGYVVHHDHDRDRVTARHMAALWPETVEVHEIGRATGATGHLDGVGPPFRAWCSCGRFVRADATAGARRAAITAHLRAGGAA